MVLIISPAGFLEDLLGCTTICLTSDSTDIVNMLKRMCKKYYRLVTLCVLDLLFLLVIITQYMYKKLIHRTCLSCLVIHLHHTIAPHHRHDPPTVTHYCRPPIRCLFSRRNSQNVFRSSISHRSVNPKHTLIYM